MIKSCPYQIPNANDKPGKRPDPRKCSPIDAYVSAVDELLATFASTPFHPALDGRSSLLDDIDTSRRPTHVLVTSDEEDGPWRDKVASIPRWVIMPTDTVDEVSRVWIF